MTQGPIGYQPDGRRWLTVSHRIVIRGHPNVQIVRRSFDLHSHNGLIIDIQPNEVESCALIRRTPIALNTMHRRGGPLGEVTQSPSRNLDAFDMGGRFVGVPMFRLGWIRTNSIVVIIAAERLWRLDQ